MRTSLTTFLVATLAAATSLSGQARGGIDPSCQQLRVTIVQIDSIDAQLGRIDREWGSTGGSRTAACSRVKFDDKYLVVVAVAGDDERTGGIALLSSNADSVLYVDTYAAAREPVAAGNRRVFFTYTRIRELLGAGQYESRYVLLCALSPDMWLPCLELPRDRVQIVLATPKPMRFEEHNRAVITGDSVRVTREVTFQTWGATSARIENLGTVIYALPRLP
jgi:hypothetical protein